MANFPVELIEYIIDLIATEPMKSARTEYLKACALTSRDWVPRCQYHLFLTIDVFYTRHALRLVPLLKANTDIAHYVRVVNADLVVYRDETDYIPSWLHLLPNIHTFLVKPSFASRPKAKRWPPGALHPSLPRITTVSVQDMGLDQDTFADFIRLMSCFPNVKRLCTDCWWSGRYSPSMIGDKRAQLPITTLKVISNPSVCSIPPLALAGDVFGWLEDTSSTRHITSLSVYADEREDLSAVCHFLKLSPSIRALSLRLCLYQWLWGNTINDEELLYWTQEFTLANSPHLRYLRMEQVGYLYLPSIATLVSAGSPLHLEEIQFKLRDRTISDPEPAMAFASILVIADLPKLRKITFIGNDGVDCASLISWLDALTGKCDVHVCNWRHGPDEPAELSPTAWVNDTAL